MNDPLLIAGASNPVLLDYAAHCLQREGAAIAVVSCRSDGRPACRVLRQTTTGGPPVATEEMFSPAGYLAAYPKRRGGGVVVFLDRQLTAGDRAMLVEVAAVAIQSSAECVCVVSTFRVHCGDRQAARAEAFFLEQLRGFAGRVVVLRPGHIVSRHSRLGAFLPGAWLWLPLVPGCLKSCCVEGDELFAAIDRELATAGRKRRTLTLLGANRPWRERLLENARSPLAHLYVTLSRALLPLILFRQFAGFLIRFAAKRSPLVRPWHVDTMRPGSIKELLALYNPYNHRHVKVVGYNNGVVHFGQKFPGRTVVSTARCNRLARVNGRLGEFDTGATIRQAMDVLSPAGKELPVVPNYSYVSLGTAFFIPIHGSASTLSTVAETIEKVLLYDPLGDRCIVARRDDPAFGHYLYNLGAEVLLLRVYLQTKDKSRYFVTHREVANPTSKEVLACLQDKKASNVEVRKASSAAETVKISQYYTERAAGDGAALELPRDALGRLWDRLEENPITSALFHGLTRTLAYHVELFLSEQEFATFWDTHRSMPILKIQLRFIHRDGFPNSPFREHDCISADLFMRKKHKAAFDAYLREKLSAVKLNPGKHSM
jgi:hypothetical protein